MFVRVMVRVRERVICQGYGQGYRRLRVRVRDRVRERDVCQDYGQG